MTEQMAAILAKKLIQLSPSHKNREAIIRYGLELIIASGIVLILMQLISIAFGTPFLWIWFVLGFAPLRSTAGGYHASSHLRCYIISSCLFAVAMILEEIMRMHKYILICLSAVAYILVLRYSPIESVNKRLSQKQKALNRKKSIVLIFIALAVSILDCFTGMRSDEANLYLLGVAAASISLVIARKKTRREEEK